MSNTGSYELVFTIDFADLNVYCAFKPPTEKDHFHMAIEIVVLRTCTHFCNELIQISQCGIQNSFL